MVIAIASCHYSLRPIVVSEIATTPLRLSTCAVALRNTTTRLGMPNNKNKLVFGQVELNESKKSDTDKRGGWAKIGKVNENSFFHTTSTMVACFWY